MLRGFSRGITEPSGKRIASRREADRRLSVAFVAFPA
jgi:hypothetical protein